jgi:hypothetical protein
VKDERALRFLLLQEMWIRRDDLLPEVHREIANSLSVSKDRRHFDLSWERDGERRSLQIRREEVVLYRPGDRPGSGPAAEWSGGSEYVRSLACELIGDGRKRPSKPDCQTVKIREVWTVPVVAAAASIAVLAPVSPLGAAVAAAAVLAEGVIGAMAVAAVGIGFYLADVMPAVACGGVAGLLLSATEPVPRNRWILAGVSALLVVIGWHGIELSRLNWFFMAATAVAAIVVTLPALILGTRRLALPVLLPFFGVGVAGQSGLVRGTILCMVPLIVAWIESRRRQDTVET